MDRCYDVQWERSDNEQVGIQHQQMNSIAFVKTWVHLISSVHTINILLWIGVLNF